MKMINLIKSIIKWFKSFFVEDGYNLFLDDERTIDNNYDYLLSKPGFGKLYKSEDWVTVKSYWEFKQLIEDKGLPRRISFDHDLGERVGIISPTGLDCIKWLTEYCLDNGLDLTTECRYHSSNTAGVINMESLINNFKKFQNVK